LRRNGRRIEGRGRTIALLARRPVENLKDENNHTDLVKERGKFNFHRPSPFKGGRKCQGTVPSRRKQRKPLGGELSQGKAIWLLL